MWMAAQCWATSPSRIWASRGGQRSGFREHHEPHQPRARKPSGNALDRRALAVLSTEDEKEEMLNRVVEIIVH